MYSSELKEKIINELIKEPFLNRISKRYSISSWTLSRWIRERDIDIVKLKNEYNSSIIIENNASTNSPLNINSYYEYSSNEINMNKKNNNTIFFKVNNKLVEIDKLYLKDFITILFDK